MTVSRPPLIAPEELQPVLGSMTLLDVRWKLGGPPGYDEFLRGHLPGAAYVDLETDLADPPGRGGRHPLPDMDRFAEAMRQAGVRSGVPVVVYDDAGGISAARCWWLLRYVGHPEVYLLDGGLSAWKSAGGAVETGAPETGYGDFFGVRGQMPVLDAASAAGVARDGVLIDARAAVRFRGEREPVDPVAGHIPGARNVPTSENLMNGRFRPQHELEAAYARAGADPDSEVGVYCGSGVTAAHDVLALELLGISAALYPGSWSEWVTDPDRPVATEG